VDRQLHCLEVSLAVDHPSTNAPASWRSPTYDRRGKVDSTPFTIPTAKKSRDFAACRIVRSKGAVLGATDYDRIGSFSPVFRCQFGEKYDAKKVRNSQPLFCGFDADPTGDAMAQCMRDLHPSIRRLRPAAKDWNEFLRHNSR